MKNTALTVIAVLLISLLTACGSGSSAPDAPGNQPNQPPYVPVVANSIDFTCIGVNNDQICASWLDDPGIFNSGSVAISGNPMPQDYLNIEITSKLAEITPVFVYTNVKIDGCMDTVIAYNVMDAGPGDVFTASTPLWGYRCGIPAYNETLITIYNASHFDPVDYPNPELYPRDQAIVNAVVRWKNVPLI